MHPFTLSRPTDVSAAIAAHAQNAKQAFIAGGTDLIGLMKDRVTLQLLDLQQHVLKTLDTGRRRSGTLAMIIPAGRYYLRIALAGSKGTSYMMAVSGKVVKLPKPKVRPAKRHRA